MRWRSSAAPRTRCTCGTRTRSSRSGRSLGLAIAVDRLRRSAGRSSSARSSRASTRPSRAGVIPLAGAAAPRPGALTAPKTYGLGVLLRALLTADLVVVLDPAAFLVARRLLPAHLPSIGRVRRRDQHRAAVAARRGRGRDGPGGPRRGARRQQDRRAACAARLVILVGRGRDGVPLHDLRAARTARRTTSSARSTASRRSPSRTRASSFANVDGVELHAGLWLPADAPSPPAPRPCPRSCSSTAARSSAAASARARPPGRAREGGHRRRSTSSTGSRRRRAGTRRRRDVLCALAWLPNAPELRDGRPARGSSWSASRRAGASRSSPATPPGRTRSPRRARSRARRSSRRACSPSRRRRISRASGTTRRSTTTTGVRFPEAYIGGPPSEFPDRYEAAEPFRLLRADLPPTLILTGEIDRHGPARAGHARSSERIRAAGAECELLVAPFADHGFDGEPNSFGAQLSESIVPAVRLPGAARRRPSRSHLRPDLLVGVRPDSAAARPPRRS